MNKFEFEIIQIKTHSFHKTISASVNSWRVNNGR